MANVDWQRYYQPSANLNLTGNPALESLKQQYAVQQQQKAQDEQNFTANIAKLNFGGAKDKDLPELQNQFGDILKTHQQLRATNDPKKIQALRLQQAQQMNATMYAAAHSKELHKQELDLASQFHNPNVDIADGAQKLWQDANNTASSDPAYTSKMTALQSGMYAPKFDLNKLSNDSFNNVKSESTTTGTPTLDKVSGEYVKPTYKTTAAKKEDFANNMIVGLKSSPKALKTVASLYPGEDIAHATQKYIDAAWATHQNKLGTDTTTSQPFESLGQKMKMQENYARLRQQYPGASNQVTPFQQTATSIQQVAHTDESAAKTMVKSLVDIIPTKGLKGDISYDVKDGKVTINIPKKRTGTYSSIPAHSISADIADPNFGAVLQAKVAQEGANVNGYNQAYKGKVVPKVESKKTISYKENGTQYDIPTDEITDFKKDHPKAQRVND